MQWIERHWYQPSLTWFTRLLLPFSWIFRGVVFFRVQLYRLGLKKQTQFSVPVIIVGNITVGGTGKTPFVIWLAQFLKQRGYKPGIVTRGAGGVKQLQPQCVDENSDVRMVGDEAVLLAKQSDCPLVVCVDRVAAVEMLLQQYECNVVIADDGLQHYKLARHIEIALIDGMRRLGNEKLLPAGPLREPKKRLKQVDFVVVKEGCAEDLYSMKLQGDRVYAVNDMLQTRPLAHFQHKTVHAVAGIGNPETFFSALRNNHIKVIEHIFPDHHGYQPRDIHFNDDLPVLMTEKDAVKCKLFVNEKHWHLPVTAKISDRLTEEIPCVLQKFY